jgi:peptidyl-prolyl cis-trans isomerase A (cyclophilin A)
MAGLSRRWNCGPVDQWAGLTAITLAAACGGSGGGEKAPPARDSVAAAKVAVDTGGRPAPDSFRVAFETTRGHFIVQVNRAWAPLGADRFYALVGQQFFDGEKFFRVVPGFVAQFGLNGDPKRNQAWDSHLLDDSVRHTNAKGTLTFAAMAVPNSRSHQLFFNLKDNPSLDRMGFAPIGVVVEGQSVVDSLYSGYGETPDQTSVQNLGNSYLDRAFPKLDAIKSARIVTTK